MNGKFIALRVVSGLVFLAVIAGIAFFAYQAGVANGSPVTLEAPSGEAVPAPYYGFGYRMTYHHPFGFGFGCFGPLLALFLLLFAFKTFRMMMWGPRWGWRHMGHHGGHGPWGKHWEGDIPPMVEEWHKKMHNTPAGGGEKPEEKKE